MIKSPVRFLQKYEFPVSLFIGWSVVCSKMSVLFHTAMNCLKLKMLGCSIGKGFKTDGKLWVWVQKKGAIQLGDHVKVNSRFGSNPVGLNHSSVFQCLGNGKISIGDHSGFSSVVLSARESIIIGSNVKVGGNVRIFDHNYHSLNFKKRRCPADDQADCRGRSVKIGDDVFIGTNAIILKGVTVGDRAVIGAGSVVSCDVPADEIWGGNPAHCVSTKRKDCCRN